MCKNVNHENGLLIMLIFSPVVGGKKHVTVFLPALDKNESIKKRKLLFYIDIYKIKITPVS